MNHIDTMKQALEYLDSPSSKLWPAGTQYKIITALRAAIEHAENQQPVAWQWLDTGTFRKSLPASAEPGAWRALYTAPPQRQPEQEPVSFDEVDEQALKVHDHLTKALRIPTMPWPDPYAHGHETAARAIHASYCEMRFAVMDALGKLTALRAALAAACAPPQSQPEQEPVAEVKENPFCPEGHSDELTKYLPVGTKLYTAPLQHQPEQDWETRAEIAEQLCVELAEERDHFKALYLSRSQRQPLTEAEIGDLYVEWVATPGTSYADLIRMTERRHGIGGEA
jgi:hypothetical protein